MENVSGVILGVSEKASYFLGSLHANSWFSIVLDVIIVSIFLYWVYLFLKETRAMRIMYGLVILIVLMLIGRLGNLILLNWILQYLMAMLVVAIPIVFQPELRAALEKLGRSKLAGNFRGIDQGDIHDKVVEALLSLSKEKIGALIVFQGKTGLREYIEQGTKIGAFVSSEMLVSLFYPKSPLHDGAVIIVGGKIVAASVNLPVSESETAINSSLGFRHRAGIGITENSDAISLIVSEETGSISIAYGGKIERRVSEERLRKRLKYLTNK